MTRDPALTPIHDRPHAPVSGLRLPDITDNTDATLDHALAHRLHPAMHDAYALGRIQSLAQQLARIQHRGHGPFQRLRFEAPQLVVFAADHGLAVEGLSDQPQATTHEHVEQLLDGTAPAGALARQHGFEVTVVDAGVATRIAMPPTRPAAQLQARKIGYGTRNCLLGPAMSQAQAVSAIHAGMDVVRHLPGNVVALGDIGVGASASAALLLSRLCGVPVNDAFARENPHAISLDDSVHLQRLERLQAATQRHALALSPIHALAAFGGFEIAMLVGAMLQAASERRAVLVDGFVVGAAALVARGLSPNVAGYLVHAQRSAAAPHRLMLIHLGAQPLLDLDLHINQGTGALLAWPLLLAAQTLLDLPA